MPTSKGRKKAPPRKKRNGGFRLAEKREELPFDASRSDFRLTIIESLATCEAAADEAGMQYSATMSAIQGEMARYMRMLRVTEEAEDCSDKRVRYNITEGKLGYVINDKSGAGFQNGTPRVIDREVLDTKR
ncbi:MAG: hypothetical protein KKB31_01885 [Nanoarchaeota archaeon]|nr:hypothetical protein [Nanoarchaeota archaeon]